MGGEGGREGSEEGRERREEGVRKSYFNFQV